jgi:hypothetical protein
VLGPAIGSKDLASFHPADAADLLTDLAKRMGRRSLAHVRSLGSSIFSLAVGERLLSHNPWREAKARGKVRAPKPSPWYTEEQALGFDHSRWHSSLGRMDGCFRKR